MFVLSLYPVMRFLCSIHSLSPLYTRTHAHRTIVLVFCVYIFTFPLPSTHTHLHIYIYTDNNQAVRFAAAAGRLGVVRLLMDSGKVDIHACDNSAIRLAHIYGHSEMVSLLMRDDHRRLPTQFS